MSRNIGWSERLAKRMAKDYNSHDIEAYAQKEEHMSFDKSKWTHQWIIVMQKRTPNPIKG